MGQKQRKRFVISFATTHGAMHFEQLAKAAGMPGRLIPVPPQVTAGCGMAWAAALEDEQRLRAWLQAEDVLFQEALVLVD